ncbi:hypothetical protein OCH239_12960 [Roseivivax halodurans JCM 10272]|uniref:Oxidoreductase n=1 Tax=Roseivivax halodurans JCM 10272 TaxID=1449350 RepID=X7EAQ9_9RHOB|nr:Gfo/Idh/MocA family oxidoreductase [Roseivivax halodurans]ETX13174.1 hypothetical protein OCH239_12960 [Roseivivax halodurans JCM 10272]
MSNRLRWGLLGAGWIAQRFAADLRFGTTGRVSCVAARHPEHARRLAERYGADAVEGAAALVSRPDVDVIYVATPAHLHMEHCLLALSRGKPVLCEKPFALDAGQARRIAETAKAEGLFCMEAMWTRFLPAMTELRRLAGDGGLGEIRQVNATLGFPNVESPRTATLTDPARGGGALLDLGVYGISAVHDLLGPPQSVAARQILSKTGSLRDVAIVMQHATGLSTICASHATRLSNRLEVSGTEGWAELDAPFIQAGRGSVGKVVPDRRNETEQASRLREALRGSRAWPMIRAAGLRLTGRSPRAIRGQFRGSGLRFQADEVAACIAAQRQESQIMPLAASIAVLETVDAVRRQTACASGDEDLS